MKRFVHGVGREKPAPDPAAFLEGMVDALRLAALPAEEQIAVLPAFVDVPFEMAQLYEDSWVLVPQMQQAGLLTDEQFDALARVDRVYEGHARER